MLRKNTKSNVPTKASQTGMDPEQSEMQQSPGATYSVHVIRAMRPPEINGDGCVYRVRMWVDKEETKALVTNYVRKEVGCDLVFEETFTFNHISVPAKLWVSLDVVTRGVKRQLVESAGTGWFMLPKVVDKNVTIFDEDWHVRGTIEISFAKTKLQ